MIATHYHSELESKNPFLLKSTGILMKWKYAADFLKKKVNAFTKNRTQQNNDDTSKELSAMYWQQKFQEVESELQTKTQIINILAHDIKNPLSGLISAVYLFKENALSKEEMQEMAVQLEKDVLGVQMLLDNMLIWGNQQKGKITYKPREILLNDELEQGLCSLDFLAKIKNIKMEFIPNTKNISCVNDPDLIQLLVRNLLSNAIKFTPQNGQIQVKVTFINGNALISITDSGPGISVHKIQKQKENFMKLSAGTNNEKGYGMGIPLCLEIAKLMGAKIHWQNVHPTGTLVEISFSAFQYSDIKNLEKKLILYPKFPII